MPTLVSTAQAVSYKRDYVSAHVIQTDLPPTDNASYVIPLVPPAQMVPTNTVDLVHLDSSNWDLTNVSEPAQLPIMLRMEFVPHVQRDVLLVQMLTIAPHAQLDCSSKVLLVKPHVTMDTSTLPVFARDALKDAQHALHTINAPHVLMDSF